MQKIKPFISSGNENIPLTLTVKEFLAIFDCLELVEGHIKMGAPLDADHLYKHDVNITNVLNGMDDMYSMLTKRGDE